MDSTIVMTQEEVKVLDSFFDGVPEQYNLLYRGTRDGFAKDCFYTRVSGQIPTLIVVKTDAGKVCGGFT
jgi:hypothetical protein